MLKYICTLKKVKKKKSGKSREKWGFKKMYIKIKI